MTQLLNLVFVIFQPYDKLPTVLTDRHPSVIALWNIQNATPAKVDSVVNENNIPIVCIQELFLTSDEDIQTDNYTWLCTKKMWAKNVGILIKKSPDIVVSNFESVSEYLCVATLLFYGKPLTVISFQVPAVSDAQHEEVVNKTKEQIKSISEKNFTVLGGDFSSVAKTEGTFSNADEFVLNFGMEIKMTWATKKKGKVVTQVTEAGKCRSSYILVSQSSLNTYHTKLNFRWIPYFEYAMITLWAVENHNLQFKLNFGKLLVIY